MGNVVLEQLNEKTSFYFLVRNPPAQYLQVLCKIKKAFPSYKGKSNANTCKADCQHQPHCKPGLAFCFFGGLFYYNDASHNRMWIAVVFVYTRLIECITV